MGDIEIEDNIILNIAKLISFLSTFTCLLIPKKPNIFMLFKLIDPLKQKLSSSPSPFIFKVYSTLLLQYLDQTLHLQLVMLLCFGYLIGYKGPDTFLNSKKLTLVTNSA